MAFKDLIDNDGRYQAHALGPLEDELAVIQYTGGTTGSPKGAMLTHANLTAACSLYTEVMTRSADGLRIGEERFLCVLPLFHIYSLTVVMLLGFRLGAELVLHPRFDAEAALKDIVEKKISVYMGVPTMHVAMLSVPGVESMDFSSLRLCGVGRRAAAGRGAGPVRGHRRPHLDRGLGHDRDRADRDLQPARGPEAALLLRPALSRQRR